MLGRSWLGQLTLAGSDEHLIRGGHVGPYYDTLHPPGEVHMMIAWKVVPALMESAEKLWQQREELRRAYMATYGSDPATWPTRHPGVVLHEHAACLDCHWLFEQGYHRYDHVFQYPVDLARRHEAPNGTFRASPSTAHPRCQPGGVKLHHRIITRETAAWANSFGTRFPTSFELPDAHPA